MTSKNKAEEKKNCRTKNKLKKRANYSQYTNNIYTRVCIRFFVLLLVLDVKMKLLRPKERRIEQRKEYEVKMPGKVKEKSHTIIV